MTLAASATLMDSARYTPASTTSSYTFATVSNVSSSIPDTIFVIVSKRCTLSPGLIRSGEYPILKSTPHFNPDSFSRIGTQISSVTPGYTVDSKTITEPLTRFRPNRRLAPSTGDKSGVWSLLTGVGTATIWNFASRRREASAVNSTFVFLMTSPPTSLVGSIPALYKSIFCSFKSNPTTFIFLAKATAIGIPTYPSPTKESFSSPLTSFSYKFISFSYSCKIWYSPVLRLYCC